MAKIAIIDDRIYPGFLQTKHTIEYIELCSPKHNPHYSHGTMCAHILEVYAGYFDYELLNIAVNEDITARCSIDLLLKALSLCLENKVDIVHISMGSTLLSESMCIQAVVEELRANNVIIVASMHNKPFVTVPGSMAGVLGVQGICSESLPAGELAVCEPNPLGINICVGKNIELDDETLPFQCSNSYIAPVVTASINRLHHGYHKSAMQSGHFSDFITMSIKKKVKASEIVPYIFPGADTNERMIPNVVFQSGVEKSLYLAFDMLAELRKKHQYEAAVLAPFRVCNDVRFFCVSDFAGGWPQALLWIQNHTTADMIITTADKARLLLNKKQYDVCATIDENGITLSTSEGEKLFLGGHASSSDIFCDAIVQLLS